MEHNQGVLQALAGDAAGAATRFAAATTRVPSLGWQLTQSLNPGSATVTRPIGLSGLPLLVKVGTGWSQITAAVPPPAAHAGVLRDGAALGIDLTAGRVELETKLYQARPVATTIAALELHLDVETNNQAWLAHVQAFVLPVALGDTYFALGDFEKAGSYYIKARDYQYLNLAIERPLLWAKLARTYVAQGNQMYRQQNPTAAIPFYHRVAKAAAGGWELAGELYSGGFAGLEVETLAFLQAADRLHFDAMDYQRRLVILEALASLEQIANGINYLGFPDDIVPIHSWRYLQNLARYFAKQAIEAERAYISFKSTAEKEEFTRLTLQQAVAAQRSALRAEQKKVDVAREQQRVARLTRDLTRLRRDNADAARADYEAVSAELTSYEEMSAYVSATGSAVHLDPDWARSLGISVTYVKETYTGLTGSSTFEYVRDTDRGDVTRLMARKRSTVTRGLELANLGRKVEELDAELAVARAQTDVAARLVASAEAQRVLAELRFDQARAQLDAFTAQQFTPELWDNLAQAQRGISRQYLDWAIGAAFLMERAFELEHDATVNRIRFDYERSELQGLLAADFLLADIDQFSYDRILDTEKRIPVKVSIGLADRYPLQFRREFQRTGRIDFETALDDFDRWHPGTYRRKLRRVEVIVEGLVGPEGLHGILTNAGLSFDRRRDGSRKLRYQKPETMVLSRFEQRGDGFFFASTEEQVLALFENSGVAGGWILQLPPETNDVNYEAITNIHLVLYFDASWREDIADAVRAEQAATGRFEHTLGLSLRFQFPDEFFALQSSGEVEFRVDEGYLPFHHTDPVIRNCHLLVETEEGLSPAGLKVTVAGGGISVEGTTDADGLIATGGAAGALNALRGRPFIDTWTVRIPQEANAGIAGFSPGKIRNVALYVEYRFTPRGRPARHDDFTADTLAAYETVDDAAAGEGGPSAWSFAAAAQEVRQTSAIRGPAGPPDISPVKPGTCLVTRTAPGWPAARDVAVRTTVASAGGGGIGVVFRYVDADNFYFFLMDGAQGYRRLGKKAGGVFTELETPAVDKTAGYDPARTHELTVAAVGDAITAALDGKVILSGRDGVIGAPGRSGLYCWNAPDARFLDLSIRPL